MTVLSLSEEVFVCLSGPPIEVVTFNLRSSSEGQQTHTTSA